MSESVSKSAKRPASRPVTRSASSASPAKNPKLGAKTAPQPKPLAKRSSAEKAPVRKATKTKSAAASTAKSAKKSARTASTAKTKVAAVKSKPQPAAKNKAVSKTSTKTAVKTPARPAVKATATAAKKQPARTPTAKPAARQPAAPPLPPRQPTLDEAAALRAFERAHKEFVRGRFSEARLLFRALIEQHSGVAEVTARSRTYLAIAEARMRSESVMPRNAEELYDRGVIELNRGDFVAAQEMFERALKRDAAAAHIHYGLAATRARLGALESALQSLRRALEIQPNLRVRAQHDPDLVSLRNEPEYEQLLFASRL